MEFFIDTANLEEIKDSANWGIIDGVTTNPSLVAKTGQSTSDIVKEICEIIDGLYLSRGYFHRLRGNAQRSKRI